MSGRCVGIADFYGTVEFADAGIAVMVEAVLFIKAAGPGILGKGPEKDWAAADLGKGSGQQFPAQAGAVAFRQGVQGDDFRRFSLILPYQHAGFPVGEKVHGSIPVYGFQKRKAVFFHGVFLQSFLRNKTGKGGTEGLNHDSGQQGKRILLGIVNGHAIEPQDSNSVSGVPARSTWPQTQVSSEASVPV